MFTNGPAKLRSHETKLRNGITTVCSNACRLAPDYAVTGKVESAKGTLPVTRLHRQVDGGDPSCYCFNKFMGLFPISPAKRFLDSTKPEDIYIACKLLLSGFLQVMKAKTIYFEYG